MSPAEIKALRLRLAKTQQQFAELLGVSFATLNRWERGHVRPSQLALETLVRLAAGDATYRPAVLHSELFPKPGSLSETRLDFTADPQRVRVLVEGERLGYGHLFNPAFAAEISEVDPLPHQRMAVYERMLPLSRLRFMLADDAGAGKTIMTGLYVRECLSRRTIRRVLIVAPAGLLGNWQRELRNLFQLRFRIVSSADAKTSNPFAGADGDAVICSLDSLARPALFKALGAVDVAPYDLVVFDEAHKLSATRDPDGTFRATDRYRLAEALAGVRDIPEDWRLPWSAHHLLLLTATPHMGKAFPYYCLWRLLEPELFSTETAFSQFGPDARQQYFIRRVKEEMVDLQGRSLYPSRICDTHSYDLTQGAVSEQALYDRTTQYIRYFYNQARILNRSAARFAMTVFQRRLASSTWALLCSFRKRLEKLDGLIDDIRSGRISEDQLREQQRRLDRQVRDLLESQTSDEEGGEGGREAHEVDEHKALGAFVATSLGELLGERQKVLDLIQLAERVYDGSESKFDKMRELLRSPEFEGQKVIVYTEHRDTLDFLVRRLEGMGFAGQVAAVHGGLNFQQRDAQVEAFRAAHAGAQPGSGARFFVGTDAAAEGINLQFCWVLINYDIPWNPARLEQRMGRIHRYGQKSDRVAILNLVAGKTREGGVVRKLLEKMEEIRKAMGSDKVFDVIGRMFEQVSLTEYMRKAVLSDKQSDRDAIDLFGYLTDGQVRAIAEREESIYGTGGEVAQALPRLQETMQVEEMRRLLPGYVRLYLERAAPTVGIDLVGDLDSTFFMRPRVQGALDSIAPLLEQYPEASRNRLTVYRPNDRRDAIFLHPGEMVFERLSNMAADVCRESGQRGALFVDVSATEPYLLHIARISVRRDADDAYESLKYPDVLEQRLVAVRQFADDRLAEASVEELLLFRPGSKVDPAAVPFLSRGETYRTSAKSFIEATLVGKLCEVHRLTAEGRLVEIEGHLRRAYDYQESELASARRRFTEKMRDGDARAANELERIKSQQRNLSERKQSALSLGRREVELIQSGHAEVIATALVQPSADEQDRKARDAEVERIAVEISIAHEGTFGAFVRDVSTPAKARVAGLSDHPGFDLHSFRSGGAERAIEVKGRVDSGDVELTENEWAKAINLREKYWLYVVFDCGTRRPRLCRVQDPFGTLVAKAKGAYSIRASDVLSASEM
ncbi:helicase-related protein [Paraburkholderia phytofirmans]|uniref:helicase-related protein n=1 Tax=Paraburkholderia phytofirmans TaxID=261302 RepID=UPI0038BD209A